MKLDREFLRKRKEDMLAMRETLTYQEIADLYKLSRQRVFRIINGNSFVKKHEDYSDLIRVPHYD